MSAPAHTDLQAESSAWRELSRRLYIELYWCDRQVRETSRRGMPILSNGKTVRDVLADAKAALERRPATVAAPEQDFDAEHAQRLALQHHAADQAQRVADLEAEIERITEAGRAHIRRAAALESERDRSAQLFGELSCEYEALQDECDSLRAETERLARQLREARAEGGAA